MFSRVNQKITGLRTFIGAGSIFFVGAVVIAADIDMTPVVKMIVKDQDAVPFVMCLLAIFFAYMRAISKTSGCGRLSTLQCAPTVKEVDEGH